MMKYSPGPRQFAGLDTSQIMLQIVYACVPGVTIATWFFGYGFLINIAVAVICALGFEVLAMKMRGQGPASHLRDNSVIVTALLFALTIPPGASLWLVVLGIGFAVLVAKHAFGGLGQNPFNPAMCGYLFLLLAFPLEMVSWHIPNDRMLEGQLLDGQLLQNQSFSPLGWSGMQQSLIATFTFLSGENSTLVPDLDGLAMATPLVEFKLAGTSALLSALDNGAALWSRDAGTGWELMNIGYLLGGIYLLSRRIITWHIPFSIIATLFALSGLFYAPNSFAIHGTPYLHLLGSATMLGAFFIATDPVSAPTTARGKLIYGVLIGSCIYCIRVWGSYLDSVAIAVIFGNFCAPLFDHLCRPRIFGQSRAQTPAETGREPE